MLSFRIAYFKVYHKEAFMRHLLRQRHFDADLICKGKEAVLAKYKELRQAENALTAKEGNLLTVLELAYEMYQRGIK